MEYFELAFEKVLQNEGGYVNDPNDPGGETYKGVSRKIWSSWSGWINVDLAKRIAGFPANLEKDLDLQQKIKDFYRVNFWDKINGKKINDQEVAISIFDFAVNAGVSTCAVLLQKIVNVETNGVIGDVTTDELNKTDPEYFLSAFTISKIARYIHIVRKRPTSQKYFYGWVRRAMGDL
jgi:lysozyme family protein